MDVVGVDVDGMGLVPPPWTGRAPCCRAPPAGTLASSPRGCQSVPHHRTPLVSNIFSNQYIL
eukprot:1177824-Prorocentrum_minimum.AAC.1